MTSAETKIISSVASNDRSKHSAIVSADAPWRHGEHHISDEYRAAVKIGPFESEDALRKLLAETGASVLDRYNAVYSGHLSRWLVALESGNDDAMIKHGSVMAALLAKVG